MDRGPGRRDSIRTAKFFRNGKIHIVDYSQDNKIVGSVEYPASMAEGQVDGLPNLPNSERALCLCCRSKKTTTVNGVCLPCASKPTKHH